MNIIYFFDRNKALELSKKGFRYIEKFIGDKKAYQFYGTEEFLKELSSYSDSSFFISKKLCL